MSYPVDVAQKSPLHERKPGIDGLLQDGIFQRIEPLFVGALSVRGPILKDLQGVDDQRCPLIVAQMLLHVNGHRQKPIQFNPVIASI